MKKYKNKIFNLHGGNPEEFRGLDSHYWSIYHNNFNLYSCLHKLSYKLDDGDIIFLSDQDDEWLDNKVSFIRNFFLTNNIDMVVHDAKIMEGGNIVTNSLFEQIGSSGGLFKNIYSNSYTGCCMAFRRSILTKILPIPNKKGIFHDAWIGILAKFYKFKVIFIATPLIVYNRHETNVSTMKRRSILKIIPDRINLINSLYQRIIYGK